MVAGLDERSRRMMEDAAKNSRDRDLTELERELEASFIADLDSHQDEIKTAVLGPESAPTVLMPREADRRRDHARQVLARVLGHSRSRHGSTSIPPRSCAASMPTASIWIWIDWRRRSAPATRVEQPRAAEEVFSTEVFEASQRSRRVDLDVGEALNGSEHPTNKLQVQTNKLQVRSMCRCPSWSP